MMNTLLAVFCATHCSLFGGWFSPTSLVVAPTAWASKSGVILTKTQEEQIQESSTGEEAKAAHDRHPSGAIRQFGRSRLRDRVSYNGLAFTSNGKTLLSVGAGGLWKTWRVNDGSLTRSIRASHGQIDGVSVSNDGTRAATLGSDGSIRLWTIETGAVEREFKAISGVAYEIAIHLEKRILTTGDGRGRLRIRGLDDGETKVNVAAHEGPMWTVSLSPKGINCATGGDDGFVHIWDTANGRRVHSIAPTALRPQPVRRLKYSPTGNLLASGDDTGTVTVWNTLNWKVLHSLKIHKGTVTALAFSRDGRFLVSGGAVGRACITRLSDGGELFSFTSQRSIRAVAISSSASTLAIADSGYMIALHDVSTGKRKYRQEAHEHGVLSIAFSPNRRHVATGDRGGIINVWDSEKGSRHAVLKKHVGGSVSKAVEIGVPQ